MSEEQVQPQLALERIYTKDISFEVPGAQVFTKQWQPELNINLSSAAEIYWSITICAPFTKSPN
mgnify:CR=1 FL=1